MKRGRDWESGSRGDEPMPEQSVPPSTATVMLDSAQVARYREVGRTAPIFVGYNGLTSASADAFTAGPIPRNGILPNPNTSVSGAGNNAPAIERASVEDGGKFGAIVNAMSGCDRTKYFGSYHDAMEWDTHRGNSIMSIRMFVEPTDLEGGSGFYVKDFFLRVPDGLVFAGSVEQDTTKIQQLLNFLLKNKTFNSRFGPHNEGWSQPGITNTGHLAVSEFCNPDPGQINGFLPPITCYRTAEKKLALKMDTTDAATWANEYVGSSSTFVIFDHKNSITNRGGFWSGFGFLNPNQERRIEFVSAFGDSSIPRYTTYPLNGGLVLRDELESDLFLDPTTGLISQAVYDLVKTNTFARFLQFDTPAAISLDENTLERVVALGGAPNIYAAQRLPAFKDSRYFLHTSDEIVFDRKLTSLFFKNMLTAGSSGGNTAFGIDYREYETSEVAQGGSVGRYRESLYDGAKYNPAINLAKNTSLIRLEIETFNEYGEPLVSDPAGNNPQARNLVPTEPFMQNADTLDFLAYADFIYPNEKFITPPSEPSDRLRTVNAPVFTLFGPEPTVAFPNTLDNIDADRIVKPIGLKNYYDNGARMGQRASNIHFLQNQIY